VAEVAGRRMTAEIEAAVRPPFLTTVWGAPEGTVSANRPGAARPAASARTGRVLTPSLTSKVMLLNLVVITCN
jgi:hypothetical protein